MHVMNTPDLVERDLHRYLHQLDLEAAREDRLQELMEERRRSLTVDRPGMSLVTEALYVEEPGYPLDEALFALFVAWQRKEPLEAPAGCLVRLLDDKAARMARQWAEWSLPGLLDADAEGDDLPF
jgi:hypothetical protein